MSRTESRVKGGAGLLLAPGLALGLAACGGPQSMLAPSGSEARQVFGLALVLFGGAGLVLLWVMATLALALFGPGRARRAVGTRRAVLWAGLVVPAALLTVLLAAGLWQMRERATADGGLTIEVAGEQWWWRVTYVAPDGRRIAAANEIRIPAGRPVTFVLDTPDVIHAFWVPALGGKRDMIPGRTNRLQVRAEREGVYRGQCAEYCGGAHAFMAFEVIALAPAAFDAWLDHAAGPAPAPAGPRPERGLAAFLSAGCGACHAIRGTPAEGTVGPDLTRIGERRSLAAAMLPNSPEALARFIRDAQHFKPGGAMPPFRFLADDELDAVAAYLTGLK